MAYVYLLFHAKIKRKEEEKKEEEDEMTVARGEPGIHFPKIKSKKLR